MMNATTYADAVREMTRQLEALEKGQRLLQQAQVPVEEPVVPT